MATLVLTVVGGIVGGPVGAAIGAFAGQQIDAVIFKPKGREGPRLADLRLQASAYGQQIPKLFGTMRVAGTVIWATDLIEHKARSGGGKGRPSVTQFSYTASIAVALSSRPIRAVRRIWADGNLLRGAGGDFRERGGFRLYDGSADQPLDPLIAAAVGASSASAFRGIAYALFEELDLTAFGNRIPSLTFEIEADAGMVGTAAVIGELAGDPARFAGGLDLTGYAASGDRLREAIAPLVEADALRLVSASDGWRVAPRGQAGAPVPIAGFRPAGLTARDDVASEVRRTPLNAVPGSIRVRHYAPERDYQLGQQSAAVAGGGAGERTVDLPAVLPAGAARALVQRLAAAASDGRQREVLRAELGALALPVGAVISDAAGNGWQLVTRHIEGDRVELTLTAFAPLATGGVAAATGAAAAGAAVSSPDWGAADARLALFDLPGAEGLAAQVPRVLIAAAGSNDGWRGADCWLVPVPGAEPVPLGQALPADLLGTLAGPLAAGCAGLIDTRGALVIDWVNPAMTPQSIDDAALMRGANRLMVGSEMVQFARAEQLDAARWRLSRLLRGRRGTASPAGGHPVATPVVLVDDAAHLLIGDAAWPGIGPQAVIEWLSRGSSLVQQAAIPAGTQALRPLAPVHGRARRDAGGALTIGWTRRSRSGGAWIDGVDAPIGEASERYRIRIEPPVAGLGPWESGDPALALSAGEAALLPVAAAAHVAQIGDHMPSSETVIPLN